MAERRIGILIANSRFPKEPKLEDLRYPENDVDGLEAVLSAKERGHFDEIVTLKNKPHYEILPILNKTLIASNKNDLVLIYYSGHGKLNRTGRLHLATTNSEFDALEATAISTGALRELVDASSTNKIVLILDCCFSGAVEGEFLRGDVDSQLQMASKGRGTYIMTASTRIQVAREKEADRHGIFTKHLIHGIQSGDADRDGDGRISMDELYNYVHEKVVEESHQEPMKWGLNIRGELIVADSGKKPPSEADLAEKTPTEGDTQPPPPVDRRRRLTLSIIILILVGAAGLLLLFKSGFLPRSSNTFTNELGMSFVYIPPGEFLMGSPVEEQGRSKSETQHRVSLTEGFYLQTTEVTQGQWRETMGSNPSFFGECGEACPVESVPWIEVQLFITRLNANAESVTYRLPTEAEWEYAARAGNQTPFAYGRCLSSDQANFNAQVSYEDCPTGSYRERTIAVGSLQPNGWGLYDMHGNVSEWCQDEHAGYPDSKAASDPKGPSDNPRHVFRGGGWDHQARECRSARRGWAGSKYPWTNIGFRLVCLPSQWARALIQAKRNALVAKARVGASDPHCRTPYSDSR